jgi:HK97 family phage major capsid protein
MAAQIKKLQDRAAAVAAMLDDLSKVEERSAEQMASIESLSLEGEQIEAELKSESAIAHKIASLRSAVASSSAPTEFADAPVHAVARKTQYHGTLRSFKDSSEAEACGRWLKGYVLGRAEDRNWCERNLESRALSSSDNSKGAVFIPESFAATVVRLVDVFGSYSQQANVFPMAADTLYIPRRTAGNTAYFVGDNSESTASDMATDNIMLSAKEVRVATRVPNSLIDDSAINLADLIAQEFALSLSKKIDDSGYAGDGTSNFGGIRGIQWKFENESLTAGTNDSGESSLSAITVDDFAETIGKLPSYARADAAWYVTPQVYSVVMQALALTSGGASANELINGVQTPRFMGYPVYFNNSMRTAPTGGQVVCLFGNMKLSSHYGARQDISVRASTDRYIEFNQTYFQAICRFDCVTSDVGDASTAGPVVALTL